MFENVELVYSPLNRVIAKDGLEIEICIYKGASDSSWCVEVIDHFENSTGWNDEFATDQDAFDEVFATISSRWYSFFYWARSKDTVH